MFIMAVFKMEKKKNKTEKQQRYPSVGSCTVVHTNNGMLSNDNDNQTTTKTTLISHNIHGGKSKCISLV